MKRSIWDWALPALGLGLLLLGAYLGLVAAPTERMMGDVYRIIFVHVPSAWLTLVAYTVNFAASLIYLTRNDARADAVAEATAEVGVILNVMLLATGSIWGKLTWGAWWSWDPRLTSAAVMLFAFAGGYLGLRQLVDDPERRATWAAVLAILIFADIPVVWYSVQWWNSLHQQQSTPETIPDPTMKLALRTNAFAFLFIFLWFTRLRYQMARARYVLDQSEPGEAS